MPVIAMGSAAVIESAGLTIRDLPSVHGVRLGHVALAEAGDGSAARLALTSPRISGGDQETPKNRHMGRYRGTFFIRALVADK
ncbi:hypothetical protein GCM10009799_02390 [Nocardiopsis rhodophaea]|uniref:Uncharacterized protein n=1 Tax=Nocardiopsis rhodophaea TaxID=280238 RepID=A0ABN2S5Y1_9ACTN